MYATGYGHATHHFGLQPNDHDHTVHAGAESTAVETGSSPGARTIVPWRRPDRIGRFRTSGYLDPTQLYSGIAISGEAGSGKTVLTHGISQWAISHRNDTGRDVWGTDSRLHPLLDEGRHQSGSAGPVSANAGLTPIHVSYTSPTLPASVSICSECRKEGTQETAESVAQNHEDTHSIAGDIQNDSQNIITAIHDHRRGRKPIRPTQAGDILRRCRQLEQQYPGAGQLRQQQSPISWAVVALLMGRMGQTGSARRGQVCRALALELKDDPLRNGP